MLQSQIGALCQYLEGQVIPAQWRFQLTPYSQRAHLNYLMVGSFAGQSVKSQWTHKMSSHCELAMSFLWVWNSHRELADSTAWWAHRDDLTNSLHLNIWKCSQTVENCIVTTLTVRTLVTYIKYPVIICLKRTLVPLFGDNCPLSSKAAPIAIIALRKVLLHT